MRTIILCRKGVSRKVMTALSIELQQPLLAKASLISEVQNLTLFSPIYSGCIMLESREQAFMFKLLYNSFLNLFII